ncbi:MAG: hypothetical protein D6719_06195 [Candidatus Dadabacteria bacterium]|nr:MAG: hypothetical protein D6719_06195 [Candidatus Dadabacteria bacterium]
MNSKSKHNVSHHSFGGCETLRTHYQMIGTGLLRWEASSEAPELRALTFRRDVAFVPVEVLESYLEDLLDLSVEEDRLFIRDDRGENTWQVASLIVVVTLALLCIYFIFTTAAILPVIKLASSAAIISGVIWVFFPRGREIRRMDFARVLNREINRRRGGDSDKAIEDSRDVLGKLLGDGPRFTEGAAFEIFH